MADLRLELYAGFAGIIYLDSKAEVQIKGETTESAVSFKIHNLGWQLPVQNFILQRKVRNLMWELQWRWLLGRISKHFLWNCRIGSLVYGLSFF
jgi:hypothetical protein